MNPRRIVHGLIAVCVGSVFACYTSSAPQNYPQARHPRGIYGELAMQSGRTHGVELLAVDDTAYLALAQGRIAFARFVDVRAVNFPEFQWKSGRPPVKELERVRLLSRFPFGIPPIAMTALLADAKQQTLDDLASVAR